MTCGPHLSLGRAALLGLALAAFAWVPVQAATAALNATDGSLGAVDVCRTYPMVCKGFFDNIKCPGYLQSWSACGANNTGSLDAYNPHCSCGPVDVTWHIHSNIIHAVVEAYYPSWVTYTPNTDNTAVNYCETYTAACHTYFVGIGGCTGNFTVSSCNGNGTLNDYNGQCKCDAYDATDYVRYGAAYAIEQPRVEKYLTQVRANTNTCRKYNNVCLEYFNTTTCPPQYSYRTNSTCGIGINNTNEQYYYQELCACGRYDFSDVDADLVIDSYVQPSYSKVAVYYPFYVTVNSYNISVTPTNLNNSYYIYNNSTQVNVYQVNSTTINITIVNNTYTDYTYYNIYDLKVDYCSTYYSSCKYALDSIACPSNLRTIRSCQYNNNITSYYGLCSCGNYNITDRIGYLILDYVTVNHYPEYIQYYTTTTTTTTTTSNGNTTTTTTTATTVGVPPTTDYYAGFGAADVPLPNATTTLAPVTVVSTTKATAVLTTTAKLTTSTIKTATTVPTTAATTKATVTVAASTTVTTIVTTTATTTMTTTKTVATTKATSASTATTTKMPQPANGSATPAPNPNLPGVPVSDSNGSGERALVVFGSILAALVVAGVFMAVFMSARRRSPVPAGDPAQYPSFTNPAFGIQMDPLAEEAAANVATLEPAPRPAEKQWPHYMGRV